MQNIAVQRRARRLLIDCALVLAGVAGGLYMVLTMRAAHADEGDIVVQRDVTPRVAYRGVPTDALPIRTAISPFPTRAFNQSVGTVMSVLSDGELGASHAAAGDAALVLQRAVVSQVAGAPSVAGSGFGVGTAAAGVATGGVGGQVVQATAGIASQISGALAPLSRGGQP